MVYARTMDAGGGTAEEPQQGWFADPFGVHSARWFSQGTPTALVRDGLVEAQDAPPGPTWSGRLLPARVAPELGTSGDDLRPIGEREPDVASEPRFDEVGGPERGDRTGHNPMTARRSGKVRAGRLTGRRPAPTPKRIVNYRWAVLAGSFGWTVLLTALILSATTTTRSNGHARTTSVYAADPAGFVVFVVFLMTCCALTGIGLYRRVRSESESGDRTGYVIAGLLLLVGVLSLASIGLTLIVLAFFLYVVARPIRRARPLPGGSVG